MSSIAFEKEVAKESYTGHYFFEALLLPFKERQAIDLLKSGKYEKVSFEGKGEKELIIKRTTSKNKVLSREEIVAAIEEGDYHKISLQTKNGNTISLIKENSESYVHELLKDSDFMAIDTKLNIAKTSDELTLSTYWRQDYAKDVQCQNLQRDTQNEDEIRRTLYSLAESYWLMSFKKKRK